MAIHEFTGAHQRRKIGFVEEDPPSDASTIGHSFEFYRLDEKQLLDEGLLATTAAVVISQNPAKPTRVKTLLADYAPTLLARDCRVFVRPVCPPADGPAPAYRAMVVNSIDQLMLPPSGLSQVESEGLGKWYEEAIEGKRLTPIVHIVDPARPFEGIAAHLLNNPPGPAPQAMLDITLVSASGSKLELDDEQSVLLRRAFSDCSAVRLVEVSGGMSEVKTLRAYVHPAVDEVGGSWPFQYFVKIGPRKKVAKEFLAYRRLALEHVPYHLGPRLRLERCALGASSGIIVSDYVSGAESLRDCARDGRAVPVIASLFNSTVWGWRNGASTVNQPLQDYLKKRMPESIPVHRAKLISASGASHSLPSLWSLIVAKPSTPVRLGVIHGDLHAMNVLVRGGDAIIIDFEKLSPQEPLLRDFACLEGGLFVDGFVGDVRSKEAVLASIAELYEASTLTGDHLTPCHPGDESSWYFDCIRQIRMQARQLELQPGQYALTLAVELLKKACNEKDFCGESSLEYGAISREQARALAYVLAERILIEISVKLTSAAAA